MSRERERIEAERAERAGRAPSTIRKIEYIDGKLNERDERKGNKRVERAHNREVKAIRREKNRKYWWLLLVIIALLVGGVAGYLMNGHFNHKDTYKVASDLVVAKNFEASEMLLQDLKYKDSQKLYKYVKLRTSMDSYSGKLDEYLSDLEALESFANRDVNSQYNDYIEEVKPACQLQAKITGLNIAKLSLSDKDMIEELRQQVEEIGDEYKDLINTKKLEEARIKMVTLEEATDQLRNMANQANQETEENGQEGQSDTAGDDEETDEDEFPTDTTDAP